MNFFSEKEDRRDITLNKKDTIKPKPKKKPKNKKIQLLTEKTILQLN